MMLKPCAINRLIPVFGVLLCLGAFGGRVAWGISDEDKKVLKPALREELRKVHADYIKAQTKRTSAVLTKTLNQLLSLYDQTLASKKIGDVDFLVTKLTAPGANMQKVIDGVGSRLLNHSTSPSNPMPFRPSSYYLKELSAEEEKDENKKKEHEAKKTEDNQKASRDGRLEQYIECGDIVKMIAEHLEPATACRAVSKKNLPSKDKIFLSELDRQFVKIPGGVASVRGAYKWLMRPMAAFEITRYPVTYAFWNEVMGEEGEKPPANMSKNLHYFWNDTPVPGTNTIHSKFDPFLEKLNEKDAKCQYNLASFFQVNYAEEADPTGENKGEHTKKITNANKDQYIAQYGPIENPSRTWSVGEKILNQFGVEMHIVIGGRDAAGSWIPPMPVQHLVRTCPKPSKAK